MAVQDTFFCTKKTINFGGKLLVLDEPLIMGILNITPDSFFDGGKYMTENVLVEKAGQMIRDGADILDIGGYSTRPGASDVSEEEEMSRVIPVIKFLSREFPEIVISVDTFRSRIAREAIMNGASIINDISGGRFDQDMFDIVAALQAPYILMHIQGTPATMQLNPFYQDIIQETSLYFSERIGKLREAGVNDIIIDPGFGFGKDVNHNYQILKNLEQYKIFDLPILAGISRKSMINRVLETRPETALNGTTVANTIALLNGADILRVHDVKEAKEAVKIVNYMKNS